ncbi:hypothetical protein Sango_1059200 [Sesamum angolense]|uniref:Uncharacterized protein n=1 Tax=Sesamum angolense TaxID=2727404 RepID=A0AAE1X0V3_9LAMI|nr:hypothetical protein Sango_1059200 [Sesamum angolense]
MGPRLKCTLVDGSRLTLSNMIILELSGSCEEVRQNIMGISCDENGIGYLHKALSMHIRYPTTKAFLGTKITKESSKQSHGVKMLSIVEKLKDLKVGHDHDTYIDVILQSFSSSYNPFIINYNMNRLEKSVHELINMLVQYEVTTHKFAAAVLVGEASTSKAKGMGKGKRRLPVHSSQGKMMSAYIDASAPLNTSAKGGYSYFITFIDDHSRSGYVNLMQYKSEAFGRFKEFRFEVENQSGRIIKTL